MRPDQKIPLRATRILNLFALGLALIFARVWYLTVLKKEAFAEEALKPKRRTVVEYPERATIRDRFNIPMAFNRVQYNAAVCYANIRLIPRFSWVMENGKRLKKSTRLSYIKELSNRLAKELGLDAQEVEDTIHAKASLFPSTPFVIKEAISEKEYYRLKMLERTWHGIAAQRTSKRCYPLEHVAAEVVGYLGAISEEEYWKFETELKTLKEYLQARDEGELVPLPKGFSSPYEVRERVVALQKQSLSLSAMVGKAGIEKALDQELMGKKGHSTYEIDTNGNFLRKLPGSIAPTAGKRAVLTLSSELQAYAQELLKSYEYDQSIQTQDDPLAPWIRGGALVVMDPKTGELLALASYPEFNPNDFGTSKQCALQRWLESEEAIGHLWDGIASLQKELFDRKKQRDLVMERPLSWQTFISSVVHPNTALFAALQSTLTVHSAVKIHEAARTLLSMTNESDMRALIDTLFHQSPHTPCRKPTDEEVKGRISLALMKQGEQTSELIATLQHTLSSIPLNDDKLLFLDLLRLFAPRTLEFMKEAQTETISAFRAMEQEALCLLHMLEQRVRPLFRKGPFAVWREEHFALFLKEKRQKEHVRKKGAKPYTDYLAKEEKRQFDAFWQESKVELLYEFMKEAPQGDGPPTFYSEALKKWRARDVSDCSLLASFISKLPKESARRFLASCRSFHELTDPLWSRIPRIKNKSGEQQLKHLASAFYPSSGYGHGRSFAYRQSTPAGSVFKLITGYEALRQKYFDNLQHHRSLTDINPMTITDSLQWAPKNVINAHVLGYRQDGTPIKRLYKRGLLPRGHAGIGTIDLVGALENSSNLYFSLLATDHLNHPSDLIQAAKRFGYGEATGIALPGEICGNLPDDILDNQTGLYSFAIGQHSLIATPLQTAVALAALGNGGNLLKPKIVSLLAGVEEREKGLLPQALLDFPFKEPLALIGITFPLFVEAAGVHDAPLVQLKEAMVKRSLFLPHEIRSLLLAGMTRAVHGSHGTARSSLTIARHSAREAAAAYKEMHPYLIGKTGTAEFYYKPTIDAETEAVIKNHIWFAALAYKEPVSERGPQEEPELVIVVYLQHGDTGRNAAPIAAQILKKWREIKNRHIPKQL